MTWEELKEEAKKMGYVQALWENCISNGRYEFYKSGSIVFKEQVFSLDRTPSQMWKIMEALK